MTLTAKEKKRAGHKGTCFFLFVFSMMMTMGCGVPAHLREDPESVFRNFLLSLDAHDVEGACVFLSNETRAWLDVRAAALSSEGVSRTGCALLRPGHVFSSTREYKKFELSSAQTHDNEAVIEIVMHDASRIPIVLRRESNRWAIDLPEPERVIQTQVN